MLRVAMFSVCSKHPHCWPIPQLYKAKLMSTGSGSRTLFFFEKPSAMRQLQRFFKSPSTVCVSAEGHLLAAQEPGDIRPEWKPWRFDALPIVLEHIPTTPGKNRSGQSHRPKIDAIKKELRGVQRVVIATDPGREGSMIAWEVLEHLGYRGKVDRLKLGALDNTSIRRAFAAMAQEPASGERDYAAYLEALCRQYEDYHLGLNGTRAISLRLRPPAFREPWRFGGVQTPTLAILLISSSASATSFRRTSTRSRSWSGTRVATRSRSGMRPRIRSSTELLQTQSVMLLLRGQVPSVLSRRTCVAPRPSCSPKTHSRAAVPSGSPGIRSTRRSWRKSFMTRAT